MDIISYSKCKTQIIELWKNPKFLQFCGVLEVIFYTILPTIILLLFSIFDENISITETKYYIHGEFLLYSIALLSSAYTTMKVYGNQKTSLIVILIIVVSISYAIVIKTKDISPNAVLWSSVIAAIFSLFYTWYAMSLKNKEQESFQERDEIASDKIQKELDYDE